MSLACFLENYLVIGKRHRQLPLIKSIFYCTYHSAVRFLISSCSNLWIFVPFCVICCICVLISFFHDLCVSKYCLSDCFSNCGPAISKWLRMILNDGRFFGLAFQHSSMRIRNPSGHVSGMGSFIVLFPTPQMIADESASLYGISQVSISHKTTPNDQMSTFSEHGSLRITSGAIHATVPAKLIFVLISFHSRLVPKSLILTISLTPIRMLQIGKILHFTTR